MKRNVTVVVGTLCLAAAGLVVAHAQDRPPTQRQETQRAPASPRPQAGQAGGPQAATEICPVGLQGLQVQAVTIPEGGALTFVVAQEQLPELRSRMRRFQQVHTQSHQASGAAMGAQSGTSGSHGSTRSTGAGATAGAGSRGGAGTAGATGGATGSSMGAGQQPRFADQSALIHQASEVRLVDTPNGVRLEVRMPGERMEALRAELRQTSQQLMQGRCPLSLQLEG